MVYRSKACPRPRSGNDKKDKEFDALEWLAAMCSHVPNKGESFDLEALDRQMVRYYGYYSNVSRGKRKKQIEDESIPYILEPEQSSKESKNWARLIQKIYEIDPLTCPKCSSQMRVISVIDDEDVIKKILKYLELWDQNHPCLRRVKTRPPLKATGPPKIQEIKIDYPTSQLPVSDKCSYVAP